jgi:mannosyltransferase OCH1-like enzyme
MHFTKDMSEFHNHIKTGYGYNPVDYVSDHNWRIVEELYQRNYLENFAHHTEEKIPKKIHQIWLGSNIPKQYAAWGETWRRFNPDWEYKLWTDADTKDVDIKDRGKFNAIGNLGQKSDYLRYHILNQFGGVYADTDFECLKSFNTLSYADFFVGVGYPSKVELYIGLIGSTPNNPILDKILETMTLNGGMSYKSVFKSTGTYFFTKTFFDVVDGYRKGVVVLPPDYFYPFPNHANHQEDDGRKYIKDNSYAIHHWAVSWRKKR